MGMCVCNYMSNVTVVCPSSVARRGRRVVALVARATTFLF